MDFLIGVLFATVATAALAMLGVHLIRSAKRRSPAVLALGAILVLFGVGAVKDPESQAIEQAKTPRAKKGEHSGDPLDDQES